MGQSESKPTIPAEMQETIELATKKGAAAVHDYIERNLNRWKTEQVIFAIIGRSATGKSTFINAVRGVKPGDKGFAKTGSGNTTMERTLFQHPQNKNIYFCDLPGVGTLEVPMEKYTDMMEFNTYDFFLIFFPDVLNENDALLAKEIIKLNKQFCFVRSKIDSDIESANFDGVSEEEKLNEIRNKAERVLQDDPDLSRYCKIFYISSRRPHIGEFHKAMEYIEQRLPTVKYEAFLNTFGCISDKIIDDKFQQMQSRLWKITALAAATSALPIPLIDMAINTGIIVSEIQNYKEVFNLTPEKLGEIFTEKKVDLKCKLFLVPLEKLGTVIPEILTKTALSGSLMAIESVTDVLLPVVGSIISATTTAVFVHRFLSTQLDNFKTDAHAVLKYVNGKERAAFDKKLKETLM